MQAAAPAPSTPRQPATTAHAHFVSSPSGTLGADLDFKLRSSVTRTPFTTPRGPPTPPDSGNKPVSVSFSLPLKTTMSHDSPLAQKTFDSASDAHASMTPSSTLGSLPSLASSISTLSSASSLDQAAQPQSNVERTPNVYVNGLPPNFPEDQLLAMTRDFGNVQSVRTFTRHVADRPSGYGFVLFDSVDSAERCIESLRKYRNLHPSFSKQLHKIPGTSYANVPASARVAVDQDPNSFKAKMESLSDTASTNLYMEGLPLSIDEPTLAALVAPHVIKSSRFFQTKLSHPPRIIAFVRLDTRQACEEVIEALHGRMVRGWNDVGSRISVRFADSNAQRELRRTERTGPNDAQSSPNKLTMAQAALLNLRGAGSNHDIHALGLSSVMPPQVSPVLSSYPGASPSLGLGGFQPSSSYDVSPTIQTTELSPAIQQQAPAHTRLPQHPLIAPYAMQSAPGLAATSSTDSNLSALLSELQLGAATAAGHETGAPALGRAVGSAGVRSKFNAFTPIEQQLLLQAQAQQRVLEAQAKALELQRAVVMEAQARLSQQQGAQPRVAVEIIPTPAEQQQQQANQRVRTTTMTNKHGHNRLASMEYGQKTTSAPHTRSTTLPNAPRVLVAPTDSPLMASPALSYSSASSSIGLSPMTPAFVPSSIAGDGQIDSVAANAKTVGQGDGAIQVVGLGVDMGDRAQ